MVKVGLVCEGTSGGMGLIGVGVIYGFGVLVSLLSIRWGGWGGSCEEEEEEEEEEEPWASVFSSRAFPPSKAAFRRDPFRVRVLVCCITDAIAPLADRGLGGRPSAVGLVRMGDLGANSWRFWFPPKNGKDKMFPEMLLLCPLTEGALSDGLVLPVGVSPPSSWSHIMLESLLRDMEP